MINFVVYVWCFSEKSGSEKCGFFFILMKVQNRIIYFNEWCFLILVKGSINVFLSTIDVMLFDEYYKTILRLLAESQPYY